MPRPGVIGVAAVGARCWLAHSVCERDSLPRPADVGAPPRWDCDVAHNPRVANDNNPDNTCARFRAGRTNSWVEVDTDCKSFRKKGANAGMQTAPLGVDRPEHAEHEH
jgi:hypothetical protein